MTENEISNISILSILLIGLLTGFHRSPWFYIAFGFILAGIIVVIDEMIKRVRDK